MSPQRQNRLNHRWRTEEAAILVSNETFLRDHPLLTARHYLGPQPQPVVLDRLMLFVTGMANIRDVFPFPRTPKTAEF